MSQLMQAIAATAMLCLLTGYAAGKYTVLTQSIDSVELASESDSDHEAIEALSNHTSTADAFQSFANENHKLTLIVRTGLLCFKQAELKTDSQDLRMTKGKIAAQAGHATLACYKRAAKRMPQASRSYCSHDTDNRLYGVGNAPGKPKLRSRVILMSTSKCCKQWP